jgi:hypothetical protein
MCGGWRKENIDLHDEVGVFGSRSCTAGRSNIVLVVVLIYSAKRPRTEKLDLNLARIRGDTPYTAHFSGVSSMYFMVCGVLIVRQSVRRGFEKHDVFRIVWPVLLAKKI